MRKFSIAYWNHCSLYLVFARISRYLMTIEQNRVELLQNTCEEEALTGCLFEGSHKKLILCFYDHTQRIWGVLGGEEGDFVLTGA